MSRVGTKFDPPQEGDFEIVDVNVLYHSIDLDKLQPRSRRSTQPTCRARLDLASLGASSRTEADRLDGNNVVRYGLVIGQETSQSGLLVEIRAIAAEICNVEEVSNGREY
jgi:hypothetical protein